jgi:hypothetical protein
MAWTVSAAATARLTGHKTVLFDLSRPSISAPSSCAAHTSRATTKTALNGALTTALCLFAAGVHMDDRDREYAAVASLAQSLLPPGRASRAPAQPTAGDPG